MEGNNNGIEHWLCAEIKASILELNDLVKAIEEFGVTCSCSVAVAATIAADAECRYFDVELTSAGDKKVGVIKLLREITGLGLKEAKEHLMEHLHLLKERCCYS